MTTFIDQKTKKILDNINNLVPEEADCEINYALKCYYLGLPYNQADVDMIVEKRNKEIQEMMKAMELTEFNQLDKLPAEETKSATILNGESESANEHHQGHENDNAVN